MFELNLNTPAKLAPAPAAVDPVLPYRILVDLISLARREEMGWPNDESIEMLLGVVGAIAAAVGDGAHRERRDCVVARAVRFYIVTRRIIVDHLAAELITLFPHEESSLKSEILMLGIYLLVESGKSFPRPRHELIEPAVEKNIAVHIDSTVFPYGIEAHNIAGESPSALVESLVDERNADGTRGRHVPELDLIVGEHPAPGIKTYLYLDRVRVGTEPAEMDNFRYHACKVSER